MKKLRIYQNEYNVLMEKQVYLPLVSGLLRAYALTKPEITKNYEFMPFVFVRDSVERIVAQYDDPAVAVFSASMWNSNLSLRVAAEVKKKFPQCLIIFGGPHVPYNAERYFQDYPFVDVATRGEGEQILAMILERFLKSRDFKGIPGTSYRGAKGEYIRNEEEFSPPKDLDMYPSPYLEGLFDQVMEENKALEFQAIIETNRGCPFSCAFCFWGQGGLNKSFRFYSVDRVSKIVEWLAQKKIRYVFCADANFGMFERDVQLAQMFAETKMKYNYPEKFRFCYGKNAEETIFQTAKLLTEHKLTKVITLARQTNDPKTLANTGRKNIRMDVYSNLQKRFRENGMATYTEIILGLPGETYESFVKGLDDMLMSSMDNQLFIYHCSVLPNTKLAHPEYIKKFGIKTKDIPLNEVHAAVRPDWEVPEYERIIVSTDSLPREEWKKATVFSWVLQLFHILKAGFYITVYLEDRYNIKYHKFYEYFSQLHVPTEYKRTRKMVDVLYEAAANIADGHSRCRKVPEFMNIYWEHEEAAFFEISNDKKAFYDEMLEVVKVFLADEGVSYDEEELREVVDYQEARFPDYKPNPKVEYYFQRSIPEYFEAYYSKERKKIKNVSQKMTLVNIKDYNDDKVSFAREKMLFSRKDNRTLHAAKWENQVLAPEAEKLTELTA